MRFTQRVRTPGVVFTMLMVWSLSAGAEAPATAARRVVATYFHRTVRCPTCQKVGSSLEMVVKTNFAAELKDGRLEWQTIDFQDPRNAPFVSAFGITGPTFVLMEVRDNRVVAWKPVPKAWGLIGDGPAFSGYVQAEVRSVLGVETTATK